MNTFVRNTNSKLCNAVSAPVAATLDALTERLPSVHQSASSLYNRMVENMGYGHQERLKDIVEKEAEDEGGNQERSRKKKSNSKNQQQPRNNNRMMMRDMIRSQK